MKHSRLPPASTAPTTRLTTLALCVRLALGMTATGIAFSPAAFAEGTKQYAPTINDYAALGVMETGSANASTYPFAGYDQPAENRLYIHIADPANEVVYIGLGNMTGNAGDTKTANYYWRIKAPDGTVVHGSIMAGGASSNISSHAQAVAGPNVLDASGYSTAGGWTFDPAAAGKGAGDYYIEFDINNNASSVGTFPDTYNGLNYGNVSNLNINWFDITVATKGASPKAIDGRLWSKNWGVRANNPAVFPSAPFGTPFNGSMFAYDDNNFVTKIDFNGAGLRPLQGQFSFNNTGTGTTGIKATDRKSVKGANATTPLHKIFLNQPDPNVYPLGSEGRLQNLPLQITAPNNYNIPVEVTQPGQIEIVLDFGNDGGFTAGIDRRLFANVVAGINQVTWDGKNGAGATIAVSQFPIKTMIAYTQGETHFTAYDVEGLDNGFKVYTQTNASTTGLNLQFWDDSNITDEPGGTNPVVRTNVDTGATTRQTWSNISYGDLNTINTWWFAYRDYQTTILRGYNTAPVATHDTGNTDEDTVLNGTTVLSNDSDPDGDTLTVNTTPVVAPAHGALVLRTDGTYTYTPNANYNGTDSFTYEISDGNGGKATAVVTLTITPTNAPPVASNDTATTAEDTPLNGSSLLANDTDPDGDTLTINTSPITNPTHGTLALKTDGTYTYTPAKDFNGTDNFVYEVLDGNGGKANATVTLTVTPVNDAPLIISTNNVTFTENDTGTALDVESSDDSDAETNGLTYSLLPMFDTSLFNIDPVNGKINFKAPPDYEAPKDSNADNAYILMVKVCDSANLCTEQVVVIVVTNVQETNPPRITSTLVTTPENQTFVTSVAATDPDANDTLTFSIKGGADASLFTIDPATGNLSFKTAPDFETPFDANRDNVYEVIVSVWDNTAPDHTDEQLLKVTVTDVQENTAPTITSDGAGNTADIRIAEDQASVTIVQATDAEGDTLTYNISGGDDAALFQIAPATGKLSFITAPDFENPADANADNQYNVIVSVKDKAGLTDTQTLTIHVTDRSDIKLQVRGFLQGPYASKDGQMNDNLRTLGLIPSAQPYGETGTPFVHKGTETASPAQLALTGNNAPVDWVLVELRDPTTPKTRVAAIAGLLQRDGDVVNASTGSPSLILEGISTGQYYVTLRHRNHLGVTTATPLTLSSTPTRVDFTQAATAMLGNHERLLSSNVALLWAGDANGNDGIIANGPSNDTNVVLGKVLTHPSNTLTNSNFRLGGYHVTDLNLDGVSLFSGPGNDINLLLGNVLLHPGNGSVAANYILQGTLPK